MGRNFTTKSLCFLTIGLLSHCYGKKKCVYSNVFSYHIASKLCNGYKSVSKKEALQNCKAPFNMLYKSNYLDYSMMFLTTPEPTVRPPSRIAKRKPSSIATEWISSHVISMWSPGIHISTPSGSWQIPVTSVVLK